MKRIISIIALFILTANIFGTLVVNAAEPETTNGVCEEFCLKVGIYNQDNYNGNKKITRGEFTEVLSGILNLETVTVERNKWEELGFEADNIGETNILFKDVDITHPNYASIKAVVDAGYMKGIAENLFGPELYMTDTQAYKVLLDLAGYSKLAERLGGYPSGYTSIVSDKGINKGIKTDENGYVTYSELSEIIYNMLDVSVMEFDYEIDSYTYQENNDYTFMNHVMGMKKERGFLVDNGYTAIDGESEIPENAVKVGNVTAQLSAENEYMKDYIGREVDLYYKFNDEADEDDNEAVFINIRANDEVITFEAEDFIGYDGKQIRYYNENNREKYISLSNMQYMIYNNESIGKFTEDTFKFYDGEITVIPKSLNENTVIVIKSIEYAYVNTVNKTEEIIYNKIDNYEKIINFSEYDKVVILSAEGEEKSINDILSGNVLEIIRNSEILRITICSDSVAGYNVTSVQENDDGKTLLVGGEKNYIVTKQYSSAGNKMAFKHGKSYTLYLNSNGEVVWAESGSGSYQVGYLIKSSIDEEGEKSIIRICGMDGKVSVYSCDEKVKISDTEGVEHRNMTAEGINTLLAGARDVIRFKLNGEGLVNYIELPMNRVPDVEDRLHKLIDTSDVTGTYMYTWGGNSGFGFQITYEEDVSILKIPKDLSEYDEYKSVTPLQVFEGSNSDRRFIAYSSKQNSFVAEYIIAKSLDNEVEKLTTERSYLAVESVNDVLNSDDEVMTEIKGYLVYGNKTEVNVKNVVFYCDSDKLEVIKNMPDLYWSTDASGKLNSYALKPGDIIRLAYDENNYITLAELVFRPSITNPEFPNGAKGAMPGSIGYFDEGSIYTNPAVINNQGVLQKNHLVAAIKAHSENTVGLGWVNDKDGQIYQITGQDLTVSAYDPSKVAFPGNNQGRYIIQHFRIPDPSKLIYINYKNGKVTEMRPATASDIMTYQDVGVNCSRILMNWYWATGLHAFVINGQ